MTFRSRLFATVALPVLSASMIATPGLADALVKPFEVAQESADQGQPTDEELLLLQQQQEEQRRAAEEEAQRQADEQKAAEEQQRAAEEEAQRQAEEQKAAEEQQRQAEEQQKAAEAEAQRQAEEQKAAEEQQRAAEEEAQRQAEEQKAAEEQQKAAEEEQQRQADEQKAAEEQQQQQAEQPAQGEGGQPAVTGEETPAEADADQPATAGEGTGQPAAEETGAEQPATAETGGEQQPAETQAGEGQAVGTEAREAVPPVVETLTEDEKQEIAKDPGQTDETVVLPVENGAAVLDSDKDADNAGGQVSREERRKKREEQRAQEEVPLPDSDDSAQAAISEEVREAVPQKIEAAIKEEGKRVDKAPAFEVPATTNIVNNTVINNTVVNNNTTVNNVDNSNNVTKVNVVEKVDNRTVLSVGDRLIVRGDDRPRLRRDSEDVYYDKLARGRVRETIVRPGGVKLVTIYNRYGDVIQRSRVGRDGREYILVYAPELEDDAPRPDLVDVGYELPPMRLRIPVRDYIIDTSSDPDRNYYDFLAEPPVERVERVYTIEEVKHSARLRDKVRRIDLDTITFATGSAEVPMSQARTLRKVADAMLKVLDKDPGETFLIEGHTDAVGSDKSNLVLSDERADSVANLLTEVYGIPPENLQTQGYGERFLKVRTQSAEQQNRRVTVRRVTTLVRPVARAD